mmetsp:Transcript_41824/g.131038  ORF Transcript_41824/g.131038 Transcript_41824/m.131038 type:complete len:115 (+) Transcript_41824:303-647(+)
MASVTTMAALASKFGHASPQDRELYRSRLRWMVTTSAAFAWRDAAAPVDDDMLRGKAYAAEVMATALERVADVDPLSTTAIPATAEQPPVPVRYRTDVRRCIFFPARTAPLASS